MNTNNDTPNDATELDDAQLENVAGGVGDWTGNPDNWTGDNWVGDDWADDGSTGG